MKQLFLSFRRIAILLFLIIATGWGAKAPTYYSFANTAPNVLSSWWTNTDGTGLNPSNYTNVADIFIIQNANSMTTTAI